MKQTALSGNIINRTWSRLKPFLRLLVYRNWWTIRKNRIALGERVRIVGPILVMNDTTYPGSISIGKHVGISNSVFVSYGEPILIGDDTLIGGGCKFYTTDFHPISPELRRKGDLEHAKTGRIVIGENAFIGAGTTVLKGVSIGNNAVIGACSVVTRDVPDNEIWGGNPARFIKRIEDQ